MKNFIKEFKEFAMRGNVIDMAIGVVIGSAFSAIITSLVNDIVTPLIAMLTSNVSFSDLCFVLKGTGDEAITLNYGSFIQAVINFIIIAFVIFSVIKAMNKLNSIAHLKKEEKKEEVPTKSPELLELEKITKLLEQNH